MYKKKKKKVKVENKKEIKIKKNKKNLEVYRLFCLDGVYKSGWRSWERDIEKRKKERAPFVYTNQ
jgi:hypothetical protein